MRLVVASLLLALLGCATRAEPPKPAAAWNEQEKLLACLDLQDHIVDLYSKEYVVQQSATLSTTEWKAFRDGWAEELAKRGTFDRFEQSCFVSLTTEKYKCGMESTTTGGLNACMHLSAPRSISSATTGSSSQ